jgi:hypothetical protein
MKQILKIISVLILFLSGVAGYFGAFAPVQVREREIGPFVMIYESHQGTYRKTGASVKKLMALAKEKKVNPIAGFAMYLDNPQTVPENSLRSEAGILVDESMAAILKSDLGTYQMRPYPQVRAVVSELPFRGTPSIIIGALKSYPKIFEFMKNLNYPPAYSVEIYDFNKHTTLYAFPIIILH